MQLKEILNTNRSLKYRCGYRAMRSHRIHTTQFRCCCMRLTNWEQQPFL